MCSTLTFWKILNQEKHSISAGIECKRAKSTPFTQLIKIWTIQRQKNITRALKNIRDHLENSKYFFNILFFYSQFCNPISLLIFQELHDVHLAPSLGLLFTLSFTGLLCEPAVSVSTSGIGCFGWFRKRAFKLIKLQSWLDQVDQIKLIRSKWLAPLNQLTSIVAEVVQALTALEFPALGVWVCIKIKVTAKSVSSWVWVEDGGWTWQ